ncbi:hypothetical protein HETIRDRAFT_108905 [Heterobasidion irregulare TC 32-1]|uniref:CCHC-type domain-containing protein n=1 Tax=Heterobasidion irregulare (strain TC 32-1) TaxID=747525 RepID=W4KA16_HETIT|nr:uncharacterized protein HETIRDRAFT_108905 [Heterobasidion irregulare TC 32-1]ETW82682.1 hypothetical protein HETIRDRAFT_108905 [Heterobasidion irregulare TC 32-1]
MFERLTDTFVKAIAAQGTSRPADRPSRQPGQGGNNCMFCGSPEHFMRACPEVTEYIRIGKCKRNIEGKVVLSSGAFESRTVGDWTDDVHGKRGADSPDDDSLPSRFTLAAGLPAKDDAPIHPYAKAQDATYAPPHERNIGAPAKIPSAKKDAPAYKTTAPIYDEKVAAEVYNRAMATQVTLTQRELLSLSTKVRSQVREATSARRSPARDASNVRTFYQDADLPYAIDDLEPPTRPTVSSFVNVLHQPETPPPGATIIPDMYETSIVPLVDHQQEVECIIDLGSQVIAMSEGICNELSLIYDPEIVLNMQSANGEIDRSLGLARNVPFLIGDITLYLQVHIIRNPAYDVLLGRPFDILTESIVKNYSNEDQTITISDPNTGR